MDDGELDKNFLLLDAASPRIQTGLWRAGKWIRWIESQNEAGRSLFAGAAEIFREEQIRIADLGGFLFCAGPGSMLGIRMAAMAIRGWQALLPKPLPIFSYSSHDLLARILLAQGVRPPFHIISDARRDHWNVTSVELAAFPPLRRLTVEQLSNLTGPLYRMEEVIRGEPPVAIEQIVPYHLETHAERFLESDLLRCVESAEPLVLDAPEYKKWSAERHR